MFTRNHAPNRVVLGIIAKDGVLAQCALLTSTATLTLHQKRYPDPISIHKLTIPANLKLSATMGTWLQRIHAPAGSDSSGLDGQQASRLPNACCCVLSVGIRLVFTTEPFCAALRHCTR